VAPGPAPDDLAEMSHHVQETHRERDHHRDARAGTRRNRLRRRGGGRSRRRAHHRGGLSGIGAACHLRRKLPGKSFTILESREAMGGTWDLFRYPGIRSDSDMFTLGFGFRPWTDAKAIADGESILRYIQDTAREYRVTDHIRYQRRVTALSWDSQQARWTVEVQRTDTEQTQRLTASFVYSCTGYYRYDEGYTPDLPGTDRFDGQLVHPQHWPEDLGPAGKRFIVIGSGATAVTLVPSLVEEGAEHVTMLQRSPSYVTSLPDRDPIADVLRKLLPGQRAYDVVRWKNVFISSAVYQASRRFPEVVKRALKRRLAKQLPDDFDVDTHFTPRYDPWDQRLCLIPNNDLFKVLRRGKASMATDRIETITEAGIQLTSGAHLEADVIVTATGLNLLTMGGIDITVDGEHVEVPDTVAYKGMMLSGVPNFAFAIGYTNASWTLKVDLVSDYVCRLLAHLDTHGFDRVTPQRPEPSQELRPLIDLTSGYVQRSIHTLPKQAARAPWRLHQNYVRDVQLFKRGELDDEGVRFGRASAPTLEEGADPKVA
jgi:cation diffusion facilitator CzcD-associated flavoprotein CzcO